ncbi:hypothetical protein V1477_010873 [Vespula maculifrons]|uniref:Uncharacterized protein n=1 Tax=Vespula maculifrons TaxID=7453 RepID=A0ABD2C3Y3_VESMC
MLTCDKINLININELWLTERKNTKIFCYTVASNRTCPTYCVQHGGILVGWFSKSLAYHVFCRLLVHFFICLLQRLQDRSMQFEKDLQKSSTSEVSLKKVTICEQ